jgi:hypothetical protein
LPSFSVGDRLEHLRIARPLLEKPAQLTGDDSRSTPVERPEEGLGCAVHLALDLKHHAVGMTIDRAIISYLRTSFVLHHHEDR